MEIKYIVFITQCVGITEMVVKCEFVQYPVMVCMWCMWSMCVYVVCVCVCVCVVCVCGACGM